MLKKNVIIVPQISGLVITNIFLFQNYFHILNSSFGNNLVLITASVLFYAAETANGTTLSRSLDLN